jgi:toxin ParE1/3/4
MAFKLIWSPPAKNDLKNIATFIAEDNFSAAKRIIYKLVQAVEQLADFPESGRMVPEFHDPVIREIMCKPFRIVYRVNKKKNAIEIVRIRHAARGTPIIE